MQESTRSRLLDLNREFYRTVAEPFDATRRNGTPGLFSILSHLQPDAKDLRSVLDVGCGNGRFARLLDAQGIGCDYTGVDGSQRLLALARDATAALHRVRCRFVHADLADPAWRRPFGDAGFDVVLCTATVQHLPGYDLRLRLLRDLRRLSRGPIILSFWQFLSRERFRARRIDPAVIGLTRADLEPGDALLPWRQGVEAIRYVHQVDETELQRLALDAGLRILETFRADGKEGNLNLYAIVKK